MRVLKFKLVIVPSFFSEEVSKFILVVHLFYKEVPKFILIVDTFYKEVARFTHDTYRYLSKGHKKAWIVTIYSEIQYKFTYIQHALPIILSLHEPKAQG